MKKTVWKVLIAALALTTALIACSNPSGEPGGGTPPGGGGPSGEVWVVSTLAGSGTSGYVEGTGAAAEFKYPAGITMGTSGNIYVADSADDRIRTITPSGVVSTLAGNGSSGYADGTGLTAKFYSPHDVAVDSEGIVYVADMSNHRIRKITTPEGVSTLAGSTRGYADGNGTAAKFDYPYGVAVNSEGTVYVADGSNHRIRKITPGGVVTTLAGSGTYGFANGNGTAAKFYSPYGVAVDSAGNVYVADANNHRIRKITPEGVVSTLAGSGSSGYADGTGLTAKFKNPYGVTVDSAGNVYVADTQNHCIRRITPEGVVSTLAGSGSSGYADGIGTAAKFHSPCDVAVNSAGTVIYVADSNNYRIRKLTRQ